MVYFIRQGDLGPIKIGHTQNMKRRLSDLQIASPIKLNILGVLYHKTERDIHEEFKKYQISGEWHQASEEILDFIKNHTVAYKNNKMSPNRRGRKAKINIKVIGNKWKYQCEEYGIYREGVVNNTRITDRIVLEGIIDAIDQVGFYVDLIDLTIPQDFIVSVINRRIFDIWNRVGWIQRDGKSVGNKDLWQKLLSKVMEFRINLKANRNFG